MMFLLFHLPRIHHLKRILTLKCKRISSVALKDVSAKWLKINGSSLGQVTPKIRLLSFSSVAGLLVTVQCSKKQVNFNIDKEYLSEISAEASLDWANFLRILNPDTWRLIIAILAAVIVAILNIQVPIHLGKVVDVLTQLSRNNEDSSVFALLWDPILRLFSIFVLQAFFTFVYIDFVSTVGENIASNLKKALFVSVMQQDLSFFEINRTGEVIDRLTTDVQEFKSAFKLCLSQGIRSSTQIFGCLVSLISVSPEMTAVMVILLPSVIFIGSLLGSKLRKISREAQDEAARSTILAEEIISNIRTVRAFGMESYECEKFEKEVKKTEGLFKKLGFGIALFQAGTHIFLNGLVLLTLSMGGYMLSIRKLSTGNIMSFLVAMQTIEKSLMQISLLLGHFVKGVASGTRVFHFIKLEPKIALSIDSKKTISSSAFKSDIQFENVTFSYPARPEQIILNDFNLTIPTGKVAAIVGSSGNGKSTVAALLLKLYNVNRGSIKISGKNINELDENWIRKKVIGFINQEPVLFATTIKENIKYGNPNATDEEVYEAAKMANADEFIRQFPSGYDTVVGEKGAAISGGQKQRIAIARAFLKKPSILVLDEATSALDTISEQQVKQSLEDATKGRTVLIIAHRLSTIRNADIIVVLNGGMIVEVGKHDDLIKKKGFYWNLMNQQEEKAIRYGDSIPI